MRRGTNRTLLLSLTVALQTTLYGCTSLSDLRPEIQGTVVDKRSGAPVAAAEVFATWTESGTAGHFPVQTLWATTDENGQFLLHATRPRWVGRITECPAYFVVHRDYGWGGVERPVSPDEPSSPPPCYRPVIDIKPDQHTIQELQNPREWPWLCSRITAAACDHACETFYGTKDICR